MEGIRPFADLRDHYNEISKLCKETKQPIFITVNGCGDTVLMSVTQYEQMKAELELLHTLAEAEEDVRQGRAAPIEDTFSSIRQMLLSGK